MILISADISGYPPPSDGLHVSTHISGYAPDDVYLGFCVWGLTLEEEFRIHELMVRKECMFDQSFALGMGHDR